ncbi:MAG TPA: tRNA pseudouridine(38-40) synthase TruA [Terriglobia bacterium]|nr:tRNA pseudouridine(38-40) synthase TruA [Terriglobia bacterium]
MRNICLVIAYDGTDFHGWQRQPSLPTVQALLETMLTRLLGESQDPVAVHASGRTDAGVHASCQVANFKTTSPIPCANLLTALNDLLPPTVRVRDVRDVRESFHARYDVRAKTYRYRIHLGPICPPFLARYVYHYPYPLDPRRIAYSAKFLAGEHDFTSFAAVPAHAGDDEAHDGAPSMVRTIFNWRLILRPRTRLLIYEVRGSGFLHHMVRNIVGTLIEAGRGKFAPEDVRRILAARDRTQAGPTAPAHGLCLVKVEYESA